MSPGVLGEIKKTNSGPGTRRLERRNCDRLGLQAGSSSSGNRTVAGLNQLGGDLKDRTICSGLSSAKTFWHTIYQHDRTGRAGPISRPDRHQTKTIFEKCLSLKERFF